MGYPFLPAITSFAATTASVLLPRRCLVCRTMLHPEAADPLCAPCKTEIPLNDGKNCMVCARPFEGVVPDETGTRCGECRLDPPPFERTVYSVYFNDAVRELIHRFKFGGAVSAGAILGKIMAAKLLREGFMTDIDLIVPLPLHYKRLFNRGYNQSYILAHEIGQLFGIGVAADLLLKLVDTPPQSVLSGSERRKNLKGAFGVSGKADAANGKNLLLVDDIMTTGATLTESSKVLLKAGAKTVACAVAARA